MQTVIAAYFTDEEAQRAVRRLEHHVSIQNIIIVERAHPEWRKFRRKGPYVESCPSDAGFLVVMIGERGTIDRAHALLGEPAKSDEVAQAS